MAGHIKYLDAAGVRVLTEEIKKRIANVYDIKGSAIYADADYLVDPTKIVDIDSVGLWVSVDNVWTKVTEVNPGWVYNIQNKFTTDSNFVEGAGTEVNAGMNIVAVNTGTTDVPVMKWDLFSTSVTLDAYQTKELSSPISLITPDYSSYATVADLPTAEVDFPAGLVTGSTAVLSNGDIYQATVTTVRSTTTASWAYIGDQITVEGALDLIANLVPTQPITAAEIRAMF